MCFTPEISASTFSIGVATRLSTCSAEAPGNGTMTFAIVTLICGSSSRGVTSTANRPSNSAVMPSSGVSSLSRNRRAMRPLMPSRSVVMRLGRLARLQPRGHRVERDALPVCEPGADLDLLAPGVPEAHLPQRHAAVGRDDVHAAHLAALDDCGTRHEHALALAHDQPDLHEHAGREALHALREVDACAEGVRFGLRGREDPDAGRLDAAPVGVDGGLARRAHLVDDA